MFWKQNDTGIYGRRQDMFLKYLERTGRFGKIIHFDQPMSAEALVLTARAGIGTSDQNRLVVQQTLRRVAHRGDQGAVRSRTFIYSGGRFTRRLKVPRRSQYVDYVRSVLERERVGVDRPLVFWFYPTSTYYPPLIDALQPDIVVADVVDDNRTWYEPGTPQFEQLNANYADVLSRSDVVLANCEPVAESMLEFAPEVHVIPNACELPEPGAASPRPAELRGLNGPIIGYAGNLSGRIDLDLLRELARARRDWNFVFLGSTHIDRSARDLRAEPNVRFIGTRRYERAQAIIAHFDVALIPHLDNDMSRSMNPLKAYVYCALGRSDRLVAGREPRTAVGLHHDRERYERVHRGHRGVVARRQGEPGPRLVVPALVEHPRGADTRVGRRRRRAPPGGAGESAACEYPSTMSTRGRAITADPATAKSIQRAIDSVGAGGLVYLPPGTYRVEQTILLPSDVTVSGAGQEETILELAPGANCHMFTNENAEKGNDRIKLTDFSIEGNMRSQYRPADAKSLTFACGGYFRRSRDITIERITAHAIRQTAFHFTRCTHVDVRHLVADQLGWSGVSTSATDDIVLRELVVTNSGLDVRHSGIHLDGGKGAYIEAIVDGCTGNGIMIDSKFSAITEVVVKGNVRNSLRGLALSRGHEFDLDHVLLSGDYSHNLEYGVVVSNANDVFVVDANMASNGIAGLMIQGQYGAVHCVVADCHISGSPDLVVARDRQKISYITTTTMTDIEPDVAMLAADNSAPSSDPKAPRSSWDRVRNKVNRTTGRLAPSAPKPSRPAPQPTPAPAPAASEPPTPVPAASVSAQPAAAPAAPAAAAAAASTATQPADELDEDLFDGTCNICGVEQTFVRKNRSLREGYRCSKCKASLRYRGQADALIRTYSQKSAVCLEDLVDEPSFGELRIWEPGVLGPFRKYFTRLPSYEMSDYWPDVAPGDRRDGIRCEDMMALTYPDASFDLVVTSDIFEHVRHPDVGFGEIHRVLAPGGRHIFSIPVQLPWRSKSVERVDTSGPEDVHILEPRYHLGPGNSQHIVYNDFGRDLLEKLAAMGLQTEAIQFESPSAEASRLLTFRSTKQ